ncbi:MAG: DUF11 domain-containing protein [Dehalococcoidia bacterium]|nr:MAG: DUF11 domain-containing protein [Dehalococcoidia bacterium]
MKRLPFRRGVVLVLALAVLAAVALGLGVFGQERAAADPGVNLVITKTAVPSEATGVVNGGTITYTLTVTNTGDTATAAGVVIRDDMSGLENPVVTPGTGVTCTDVTLPIIECATDVAMGVGESRTVTIAATVSAASGYVYNGAYVDPLNGEPGEDNEDADDPEFDCGASGGNVNEGTDTAPPTEPDNYDCTRHGVAMPDLTITKTASPLETTAVSTGSTITYTLTVSNSAAATGTATNVLIRDTIGSNLTYASATPGSGVVCGDLTPPVIECTAASIAPGETRALTIAATVAASTGTLLNGAYVDPLNTITEINEDADDPDLDCSAVGEGSDAGAATEADNFDCTSHTATGLPDLTITKAASPSETTVVDTGDTITYTLTVTNSGAATATSVDIQDTIGSGLTLGSVTPGTGVTCGDTIAPEINCVAASIAAGESRTVTIVVSVSATSGTVLNGAAVDPDDDIDEVNEDADDPTLSCSAVGEGTDAGDADEADNFDCTSHAFTEASPTPTATPTAGQLLDCPLAGKWAMSVWDGLDDTATGTALDTCAGVTISAAYALDRVTNTWYRYFPGRPDINNLLTLDDMQAIFTFGQ